MSQIKTSSLKLLRRGKVKDIYLFEDDKLLFEFSNRVSAFDVILPSVIPRKGEVLCKFARFWFNYLETPHHMLEVIEPNLMVVKKLDLIPIEFIVRGYLYGSLYERVLNGEMNLPVQPILASELPTPIFDPTTKSETKDVTITLEEILAKRMLDREELRFLTEKSINLYLQMKRRAAEAGFIIADVKFEFAKNKDGSIILADSIGPDEFRLWPQKNYQAGKVQESFDKQLVRDWLIDVGYKKRLDEARKINVAIPPPPHLPSDLIAKVTQRYVEAYESLTGLKL